ncbi:MAG: hypothetical protein LKG11_05760 [Bacilli bacterium]|jgi:hypothetical protein|nr:hypothetical protein [Bacilli bacterium]
MKLTILAILAFVPMAFGGEGLLTNNKNFTAGELPNISISVLNKLSQAFSGGNNISGIEGHRIITIVDGDETKEGTFIDFNGEEGYATIGTDFAFYDFQDEGESPYKNFSDIADISYNTLSGYLFTDQKGTVNSVKQKWDDSDAFLENTDSTGHIVGKTGAGCIGNVQRYLNNSCGGGWSLIGNKHLNMQPFDEMDLSAYVTEEQKDGYTISYSEGNCCLVAPYTIAQYFQKEKWDDAPSSNSKRYYHPSTEEKALYDQRVNSNGTMKNEKMHLNYYGMPYWPKMYIKVRTNTVNRYGKVEGLTVWDSRDIVRDLGTSYGHDVGFFDHVDWGAYSASVPSEINSDRPLLWSMSTNTYGSHTTALCGYKIYTKETGWWIFKSKQTKLFFELCDGWTSSYTRFFDSTAYFGFAALIRFTY